MKKTALATALAAVLVLGACSQQTTEDQTQVADTAQEMQVEKAKPELGTFGIDLSLPVWKHRKGLLFE